jgi:N6-L-threonylcarbamoyladenine synthase
MNSEIILGIECSCDDTCIGIMQYDKILSNVRISQQEMCNKYGGVVPDVAARTHFNNLYLCIEKALQEANLTMNNVDIIACTIGPGLIGSLVLSASFARYLSILTNKIFIPVHHLEAHLDILDEKPPYLAVIISGGHSQILYMKNHIECIELCNTRDDAFGELLDKVGREMGLDIPSGPSIEKLAELCQEPISSNDIISVLPNDLAFSCSGLKTHFIKLINSKKYSNEYICKLLQHNIAHNLHIKIQMAISQTQCSKIIIGGGVSANKYIRSVLDYCIFAPISLCTDNGIMICKSAMKHYKNNSRHINNYSLKEFSSKKLTDWYSIIS